MSIQIWTWLRRVFTIDCAHDERCQQAEQWWELFEPKEHNESDMVLQYATQRYEELGRSYQMIDDKADGLLRVSGAIAGLMVAAVARWEAAHIGYVVPAFVLLLLSMIFAVIARMPVRRGAPPAVSHIIDGVPATAAPRVWLAGALHRVTENFRVAYHWRVRMVLIASWLLIAGVAALSLVLWAVLLA